MGTTKYKYSLGQIIFDIALILVVILVLYVKLLTHHPIDQSGLIFGIALLIPIARFVYVTVMYIIPCFRGKAALQLDSEKLQLFITGKLLFQVPRDVAYWKDIKDIEYYSPPRGWTVITFKMNDGSSFGFNTTYMAGEDEAIYDKIMEYFKKYSL